MFFTKKTLIRGVEEQISLSFLSKINLRVRNNLVTPLKIGLFHGRNTYGV